MKSLVQTFGFSCGSVDYLLQLAGHRTVPVELGARYTDQDWSQNLMTVGEFISQYIKQEVRALCPLTSQGEGSESVLLT